MIITGPKRPSKALINLQVHEEKAWIHESLFSQYFIDQILTEFKPEYGYFYGSNKEIYDHLWEQVFESLTGEPLRECLIQELFEDNKLLEYIDLRFGSIQTYIDVVGHHPLNLHGVNLTGSWIISTDKKNLALLTDEFHEFGHRVYPNSATTYDHELGAYYFMLLSYEKVNTEVFPFGLELPKINYGKQPTLDHQLALNDAQRLVNSRVKYYHQVN